jgi:hypothetical protein
MAHALLVEERHAGDELLEEEARLRLPEPARLADALEELPA